MNIQNIEIYIPSDPVEKVTMGFKNCKTQLNTISGAIISIGLMAPIVLTLVSVDWHTISLIGLGPPLLGLLLIYFIPESPAWCVTRVGRYPSITGQKLSKRTETGNLRNT